MDDKKMDCPVEITLAIIGSKWKVLILRELMDGTKRFSELDRGVNGITQKMLTQQLRQMEKDDIVSRKVHPIVPPRVDYSLTKTGKSLVPVLNAMCRWGSAYKNLKRGKKPAS